MKTFDEKIFIEVEEYIDTQINSSPYSLFAGKAGIGLYYAGRYLATKNDDYKNKIFNIINLIMEDLNDSSQIYYSFANGWAGVGWFFNYLYQKEFLSKDNLEILDFFDQYIISSLNHLLSEGKLDYLHEASGCILYLLKRTSKREVVESLKYYVKKVEELSLPVGKNGVIWSYENSFLQITGPNFSLSHGIASTINILLRLYSKNIEKSKCKDLIYKAVNGLMNYKKEIDGILNLFPSTVDNDGNETRSSQLAWCYGDLGILYTLYLVGLEFKDDNLEGFALSRLSFLSNMNFCKESNIADSCFCHGTSGIAYIFHKLFKLSNKNCFKDARDAWALKTKEFYEKDKFFFKRDIDRITRVKSYIKDASLLDGCTSVLQVFNTLQNSIEDNWDEIFLLSLA